MTQQQIEIKQLDRSPLNVRKTDINAGLEELKASILAHGLMQNLVVVPAKKGKYHVIAGGRRLEALRQLQAEGKLPGGYAAPCQIADPEQAMEMSLAENVVRQAMHPADQYETWAALADAGNTTAKIAERFGVEESLVLKRLKLGRVAPALLEAYREGKLSLESLMAFTITDDHKRQMKVYKSLQGWQKDNARHIRQVLTERMVEADDKLVKFVGLDTYLAAGGTKRQDLFEDAVYLENPELLNALVIEKLSLVQKELEAEGWGWLMVRPERDWSDTSDCSRIHRVAVNAPKKLLDRKAQADEELAAIRSKIEATEDDDLLDPLWEKENEAERNVEEIEEEMEAYAAFDPEQMKHAGCYVTIDHQGKLSIDKGLVRKQDQKKLSGSDDGSTDDQPKKKDMPDSLRRSLEGYRLQAAQLAMLEHPALAFDLLIFTVCRTQFAMPVYTGPEVNFRRTVMSQLIGNVETEAGKKLNAAGKSLPLAWLKEKDEAAQFEQLRALPLDDRMKLLAFCVGQTLRPRLYASQKTGKPCAYESALGMSGVDVAAHWRPTAENYLKRITTEQLLGLGQEMFGGKWAMEQAKSKKGDLVKKLDQAFANPDKHEKSQSYEEADKLRKWLPAGMAFPVIAAPKPVAKRGRPRKVA